jgi:ubiquinone/menaquinone biosynthesis C-methylase UbiE
MHQQRDVWETIAASFAGTRPMPWPPVYDWLSRLMPHARVLDAMGGHGRHSAAAARIGLNPVLLDWSRNLLRLAPQEPLVHCVQGDASRLPCVDHCFDAALMVAGLPCVPDADGRRAALAELRRVVVPGGPVLLTAWSRNAPRFSRLHASGPTDIEVPWRADGHDATRTYHLYTLASLRAEVEGAGFAVRHAAEVALAGDRPDNLWFELAA